MTQFRGSKNPPPEGYMDKALAKEGYQEDGADASGIMSINSSSSGAGNSRSQGSSSGTSQVGGSAEAAALASARREFRRIVMLRTILGIILLVGASLAAYFMYQVTRDSEIEQFETHYQENAIKLIDTFEARLVNKIAAIDNYAVVSSTEAIVGDEWPFVVAPKFEVRASSTRALAGAGLIVVMPLVKQEEREMYEEFTVNNTEWIEAGEEFEARTFVEIGESEHEHRMLLADAAGRRVAEEDHEEEGHGNTTLESAEYIFAIRKEDHVRVPDTSNGPYFPAWQMTPVHREMVNYNIASHPSFGDDVRRSANTTRIVFSKIADVSDIHDPFHFIYRSVLEAGAKVASEHIHNGEEEGEEEIDHEEDEHHDDGEEEGVEESDHDDEHHDDGEEQGGEDSDHEEHDEHEEEEAGFGGDFGDPVSITFFPIFDHIEEPRNLVGMLAAVVYWSDFFVHSLSPQAKPILVVLSNDCFQVFTYEVVGEDVRVLGEGDRHLKRFDSLADFTFHFDDISGGGDRQITFSGADLDVNYCPYRMTLYPTSEMESAFLTSQPALYASMIIATFLFASVVFIFYDMVVTRRQRDTAQRAAATSAVVNSLFPANVRERLFQISEDQKGNKKTTQAFLNKGIEGEQKVDQGLPIADLFPYATVLFADIAGFTAWSSSREPTQVFILLETIYGKFDKEARRKRIFKVETIGDCYVAATGVPEAQKDHAIRMAQFALSCLEKLSVLTKELESTLGPDTGTLQMRIGIHSGSVTAGVLRGEKSRFQLFGDTVNTASRMESTGEKGRIQCSEATATILRASGHESMLVKRDELVAAKGKGQVQTYWVIPSNATNSSSPVDTMSSDTAVDLRQSLKLNDGTEEAIIDERLDRLVDWNVDVLHRQLRNLVAYRQAQEAAGVGRSVSTEPVVSEVTTRTPRMEIKEAIAMPNPDAVSAYYVQQGGNASIEISPIVLDQLRDYIRTIAYMYRNSNPFHNFDHSAHVTLSTQKLLSRIVSPSSMAGSDDPSGSPDFVAQNSNVFAYGISCDPLTHCAIIFSAIIHDVDHQGVSNQQLIAEGSELASAYDNKSVAEQNSIDLAWDLLMEESYEDLRACIFPTQEDHDRFRSLVVNAVIATDIFDKELKEFRQTRWDKAFGIGGSSISEDAMDQDTTDLKATIVIEHLIQASDVAHTMQHWHVYQKWNEKLFAEMYLAYKTMRMEKNPADGWYQGELWFFDNYIVPLAKKLFECGVFGVSSDEYLGYALENRREWALKGESLVSQWVERYNDLTESKEDY